MTAAVLLWCSWLWYSTSTARLHLALSCLLAGLPPLSIWGQGQDSQLLMTELPQDGRTTIPLLRDEIRKRVGMLLVGYFGQVALPDSLWAEHRAGCLSLSSFDSVLGCYVEGTHAAGLI